MKLHKVIWEIASVFVLFLAAGCATVDTGSSAGPGEGYPVAAAVTPTQPLEAPSLVSSLLQYPVMDEQGRPVAQVSGLLLDMLAGQISYLGMDLQPAGEGRPVLAPWQAFTLEVVAPDAGVAKTKTVDANTAATALLLRLPDDSLTKAPLMDRAQYRNHEPAPAGWDRDIRDYWAQQALDIPVTGEADAAASDADPPKPVWISGGKLQDIDYDVLDAEKQPQAEVKDFVVASDGKVVFAIIAPATQRSLGNQLTLIPWTGLSWLPDQAAFLLNLEANAVERAPRLNPEDLPDFTLPGWDQQWRDYWSAYEIALDQATPQPDEASSLQVLGSDLAGTRVVGSGDATLGLVVDWSINPRGISRYIVLQTGGKLVPVAWPGLTWQPDGTLLFTANRDLLDQAPSYSSLANLSADPGWIVELDRFWNQYLPVSQGEAQVVENNSPGVGFAMSLVDSQIQDVQGQEVGQVADFLLDATGNVQYVIVNWQDQYHPLPWGVLDADLEQNRLLYLDDPERLPGAPGFTTLEKMTADAGPWDAQVRQYWGMK